jgi:hypothetical protein
VSWYFIDEDMIEAAADLGGQTRIGHHLRPVEQQVVVIEDPLPLLRFDIGGEKFFQRVGPFATPREGRPHHLLDRHLAVDAARVDRKAGAFQRKPRRGLRKPEAMPYQVQEIGRVLAVMDREGGIETDLVRVSAQQPGADRVKGAGPAEPIGRAGGALSCRAAQDTLGAPGHLRSGSP